MPLPYGVWRVPRFLSSMTQRSLLWAVPRAWTRNTAYRIPAGGHRSCRTSATLRRRGQSSTAWAGRSTMRSPTPALRACFRPRFIRHPAGITPPLIGLRHFSMSWKTTWITNAGTTGISIGMPARPSATPCSTTACSLGRRTPALGSCVEARLLATRPLQ